MLKRLSILGLALLLAFYPVNVLAEANTEADQDDETVTSEDNPLASQNTTTEDEEKGTSDAGERNNNGGTEEPADPEVSVEEEIEAEVTEQPAEEGTEEEGITEDSAEEETAEQEVITDDEVQEELEQSTDEDTTGTEVTTQNESDIIQFNDVILDDVSASVNGTITYDVYNDYYVLDLNAEIANNSDQELNGHYLAFALPEGVELVWELIPDGVYSDHVEGKAGLLLELPDLNAGDTHNDSFEIPLTGVPQDESPDTNVYLYENMFSNLGSINDNLNIDFSVMTDPPSHDLLSGTVTGTTEYDEEKQYHFLHVTIEVTNEGDEALSDFSVGFDLPEDVMAINNDDTPEGLQVIEREGVEEVVLALPELAEGATETITYEVPVIGVSETVVEASTISTFLVYEDFSLQYAGEFDGEVLVDFSEMNIEWHFDASAEILAEYTSEINFEFNYDLLNLNLEDVDDVRIQFQVPSEISILDAEYEGFGDVEIEWDGNTATLIFGDLPGASGYEGYFTAYGETDLSVDELLDIEVTATLYRDGDTEVETISVPFVLSERPEPGDGEPSEPSEPSDPGPRDDAGDENGDRNDDRDDGNGDDTTGSGDEGDDTSRSVENEDEGAGTGTGSSDSNGNGGALPDTATSMYNMLLIGALMLIAGVALLLIRKRMVLTQ